MNSKIWIDLPVTTFIRDTRMRQSQKFSKRRKIKWQSGGNASGSGGVKGAVLSYGGKRGRAPFCRCRKLYDIDNITHISHNIKNL